MILRKESGLDRRIGPDDKFTPRRGLLWIDDEVTDTSAEVRWLTQSGFDVLCVQSADAALSALGQESFAAMLLDLRMPGKSGLDLLAELSFRKNRIPVVVLTGFGTMDHAVAAMKLGAVDVLAKPVDVDLLTARLHEVKARYPDGADSPMISEDDWVRVQCERLSDCIKSDDAIAVVARLLLNDRVTLRHFHGCSAALRLLLNSRETSLALLKSECRTAILNSLIASRPTRPRVCEALASLESGNTNYRRAGLSRAYLSRRVLRDTGRRLSEWSSAAVVRTGFRRLVRTFDSVQSIAFDLGYEHSQFDREFARAFGGSPTAVRRRVVPVLHLDSSGS